MSQSIAPPKSVLLLVGREDFTPPSSFGGNAFVATVDCLAVAVVDEHRSPTSVTLGPAGDTAHLLHLGDVELECEGLLSLRDVFSREYDNVGVEAGLTTVSVWADNETEPSELVLAVHGL